jgi:hypothetical protein
LRAAADHVQEGHVDIHQIKPGLSFTASLKQFLKQVYQRPVAKFGGLNSFGFPDLF